MSRIDALAAGTLVSVAVFTWLAGPLVEAQFGTEALIAIYAGVACAAGVMTYVISRRIAAHLAATSTDPEPDADAELSIDLGTIDVDQELDQLQEE